MNLPTVHRLSTRLRFTRGAQTETPPLPVMERRLAYRPELDGLRAVAVGLVMLSHSGIVAVSGDVGVTAFFVLSGHLITNLLLAEQERTGTIDLRAFYGRRLRRLAPALLLLLGATAVVGTVTGLPAAWPLGIAASLFYVSNWVQSANVPIGLIGHTWTLSIEEQFYAIWPWFLRRVGAQRAALTAIVLILAVTIIRTVASGPVEYFATFARGDAVLVGCVLAIRGVRLPSWAGALGLLGLVLVAIAQPPHDLAIPLAIAAAGVVVTSSWTPLGVLAPMGRRAYGLYLWDWPLAQVFGPLSIPLTFLVAEASWRFVEQPVQRLRLRHAVDADRSGRDVARRHVEA